MAISERSVSLHRQVTKHITITEFIRPGESRTVYVPSAQRKGYNRTTVAIEQPTGDVTLIHHYDDNGTRTSRYLRGEQAELAVEAKQDIYKSGPATLRIGK